MPDSLPILGFHCFEEQPSAISFSPGLFRRAMAGLQERGYRAAPLAEAVDCLRQRKPFPDHAFILTFDDGYQTVYEEAFPCLQQHGWGATVFLTVGSPGSRAGLTRLPSMVGRSMLSWGEIREMQRHGMEIGAHTLTHPDLTRASRDRVEEEVRGSKDVIEAMLGTPVVSFCYPYGYCDAQSRDVVRQHFSSACSGRLGLVTHESDLFALERVEAHYLNTDRRFRLVTTGMFPWYLWMRRIPRKVRQAMERRLY